MFVNHFELCRKSGCLHYRRFSAGFYPRELCGLWCKEVPDGGCKTGKDCQECQNKEVRPKGCLYHLEHLMAEEDTKDLVKRLIEKNKAMTKQTRFKHCMRWGCKHLSTNVSRAAIHCDLLCDEMDDFCGGLKISCGKCQTQMPKECPWKLELLMLDKAKRSRAEQAVTT